MFRLPIPAAQMLQLAKLIERLYGKGMVVGEIDGTPVADVLTGRWLAVARPS